ncbi:MAG TPA: UDP-N-acetylmuramate dehydrogenase [Cellvibrionaceae bacterium]|nr:UDP-N-acetylmuramate dehydrogenase [Cellvibrionaceae bacterium]
MAAILSNYDLQPHNSLACPARAEFFCAAQTLQELTEALAWADERALAVQVLGGGSNLLCAPFIPGLTLQPTLSGRQLLSQQGDEVIVELAAGENWHQAVLWCSQQGWYGLENLALIPGSAGAAPIQNIGAYGVEISQLLTEVVCFNRTRLSLETLKVDECALAYRDSIFKHSLRHSHIILAIRLKLSLRFAPDLTYPALNCSATSTPEQLLARVISLRQSKLPDPNAIPNAGSFFKNPVVSAAALASLKNQYPAIPHYPAPGGKVKLAAAWLIEQAGCKGQAYQGITVHAQQALVLTNPERRPRTDVLACAAIIAKKVVEGFGIELEIEPQLLG